MNWNYRIVKNNKNLIKYGLYEVYYEDGKPIMRTEKPIISGDTPKEIKDSLKMMLEDSKKKVLPDNF